MRASQVSSVKAGNSYCDIYLAQLIPLSENSESAAQFSAKISFTDSTIEKDPTSFSSALSGSEYEQAKAILRSTAVK